MLLLASLLGAMLVGAAMVPALGDVEEDENAIPEEEEGLSTSDLTDDAAADSSDVSISNSLLDFLTSNDDATDAEAGGDQETNEEQDGATQANAATPQTILNAFTDDIPLSDEMPLPEDRGTETDMPEMGSQEVPFDTDLPQNLGEMALPEMSTPMPTVDGFEGEIPDMDASPLPDDVMFDDLPGSPASESLAPGSLEPDLLPADAFEDAPAGALNEGVAITNNILSGNDDDNSILGSESNEQIGGYGGDDTIDAGAGNDSVVGGMGDDDLWGGMGDDHLTGENGDDLLVGGSGDDALTGSLDNDTLLGGEGDDALLGGDGTDVLDGGAGNDALQGGFGDDIMVGGTGEDVLMGGYGNDALSGVELDNDGKDMDGPDYLNGGAGNDTLILGAQDVASGGADADTFILGDWISDGAAAQVSDFDPEEDALVLVYDDSNGALPPDVALNTDETDPTMIRIALDGVEVALVNGGAGLTPADIALVGQSAAQASL